jgi:hypothetical protein
MTPFATGGRYVIRVLALAGREQLTGPGEDDKPAGQWVRTYDPEYGGGRGVVDLTRRLEEAARFPSMQAALACYRYVPRARRTRPDGKLNRPMTAYTVDVGPEPDPRSN